MREGPRRRCDGVADKNPYARLPLQTAAAIHFARPTVIVTNWQDLGTREWVQSIEVGNSRHPEYHDERILPPYARRSMLGVWVVG